MPEEPVGGPSAPSRIRSKPPMRNVVGAALGAVRNQSCILAEVGRANGFAPTQKRVPSRLLTKMPGRNAIP